jgi:hypothetical protein
MSAGERNPPAVQLAALEADRQVECQAGSFRRAQRNMRGIAGVGFGVASRS